MRVNPLPAADTGVASFRTVNTHNTLTQLLTLIINWRTSQNYNIVY